jgi:16S rRNA (cytosine1402-N4)-methyltransferase
MPMPTTEALPPHRPVMLAEVLDALAPLPGQTFVDGTFGAGGYTRALLDGGAAQVIAIDRDPVALAHGAPLKARYGERIILIEGRFSALKDIIARSGAAAVDGVVLDIGFSSMQIDDPARGFSFMRDGPLDMRMGRDGPTAADLVNELPEETLTRVLGVLGEERRAGSIARAIVRHRRERPLARTGDLADLVERVLPRKPGDRIHPATRSFQALRILVNGELQELVAALVAAEQVLREGGRLAVVTFHSLEDRIVKQFLAQRTGRTARPSRHAPLLNTGPEPSFRDLLPGGRPASEAEASDNPRARSARLRAAVRTGAAPFPLDPHEFGGPVALAQAVLPF